MQHGINLRTGIIIIITVTSFIIIRVIITFKNWNLYDFNINIYHYEIINKIRN